MAIKIPKEDLEDIEAIADRDDLAVQKLAKLLLELAEE